MERLKAMKERLMTCVESQLGDLSKTNAEELGEVVDMIKDLEETIYYCTVVEAMEKRDEEEKERNVMYYPIMYTDGGSRYYRDKSYPSYDRMYYGSAYDRGMRDYDMVYPRDIREGRSGSSRRMYMESKEMHEGKEKQMHELETYMHELSGDIMDMINDATPEEKEMLSHKLSTLAEKIK